MKPLRYLPHYTVEDYNRWEGQWELIHGLPYDMSPSPKRKHQWLSNRVSTMLTVTLSEKKQHCSHCEVYYEFDWVISDDTIVRPDIMIVCGEFAEDDFLKFPPTLVVEILSPSTAMKDRSVKYDIYEQQKVKYYILLNPDNQSVKIYTLQNDLYIETETTRFDLHGDCKLEIDLQAILNEMK